MSRVLVAGATGLVGRDICRRLAARGVPVRGLVRSTSDPAKVAELRDVGAEIAVGDVRDVPSLDAACAAVDAVISTLSAMPFAYDPGVNDIGPTDRDGTIALVDAAKRAGARAFVYMSFSGGIDRDFPSRHAKRAVETHVRESGLDWTVLRPSYFMEVWLSPAVGFDAANATATIFGTGENPISWIAIGDVAEFAVRALDAPAARDATLELGGPAAVAPDEVVRIFEGRVGRPFTVTHVPMEALEAAQAEAPHDMARSFAGLQQCYAAGDPIPMDAVLAEIPVDLTSVDDYATRVVAGLRAAEA
jgi:NADH dehydrogenase